MFLLHSQYFFCLKEFVRSFQLKRVMFIFFCLKEREYVKSIQFKCCASRPPFVYKHVCEGEERRPVALDVAVFGFHK